MIKTKLPILLISLGTLFSSCSLQGLSGKQYAHLKPTSPKQDAGDVIKAITLGILENERDVQHGKRNGWRTPDGKPLKRFPPE